MADQTSFNDLLVRVRAGDGQAAEELVRRYEPALRLTIRARLTDPALRRLIDSMDILQSVLGSFFVRCAGGQYDLEQPNQLIRLLETMARNKLLKEAAKHRAGRRDVRRLQAGVVDPEALVDPGPSPSFAASLEELLHKFHNRLTPEERWLVEQRVQGRTWTEIAAEQGGEPNGLRMRFTRAVNRAAEGLDLC